MFIDFSLSTVMNLDMMGSWADLLAALVLAASEICMLNSKVSFSRLLNLVRVLFFQCLSFSSH
mgnify:CR=1 FL=1